MTVHKFERDLRESESPEASYFWECAYRAYFPNFVARIPTPGDFDSQRRGVDCLVFLGNDRLLRIDEKLRFENYSDIFLEYVSNTTTHAKGWVEKDLNVDYIAYGIKPTSKVYLLDWLLLQRAWRRNRTAWKKTYPERAAPNEGYTTLGIGVPYGVIAAAMNQAAVQIFDRL